MHTREDESVYVLQGSLRFKLDGELNATPPGSFVFIPRGVAHSFQNAGEEPGRMLVMFTPAGMEDFFDRLSDLTERAVSRRQNARLVIRRSSIS